MHVVQLGPQGAGRDRLNGFHLRVVPHGRHQRKHQHHLREEDSEQALVNHAGVEEARKASEFPPRVRVRIFQHSALCIASLSPARRRCADCSVQRMATLVLDEGGHGGADPAADAEKVVAYLELAAREGAEATVIELLEGETSIGRVEEANDVALPFSSVSTRHAIIEAYEEDELYTLRDVGVSCERMLGARS